MQVNEFIQARQADWQALTTLLERGQRSLRSLTPAEVQEMGRLYRAASADLALAQRDFAAHTVAEYLNQLVGRAHALVYHNEPLGVRRLLRFVTHGYPAAVRQVFPFIAAAALLLIIPALAAGWSAYQQPQTARWLLPPEIQHLVETIESQQLWTDIPVAERPYASSFIMRNNIQVSFLAFGGGMLAGILTVWILLMNGLMLGAVSGLTAHYGIGLELWTFVIGHGVVELSVIAIAGGAGLRLGWAMLRPGLLRRRDALALAARQAVRLVIGCVPLLVYAGLVEGFISPAESIPPMVKWGVGLGSGLLLYAYLFLSGVELLRRRRT